LGIFNEEDIDGRARLTVDVIKEHLSLFSPFLFTINVIRQMALLFSKVGSNKLWHNIHK